MLLKITLKKLDEIKLLPEEKKWLEEVLRLANHLGIEIFLFWSRLNWWGADIDLIVKSETKIKLSDLIKLSAVFHKYSDTKIDIIPYDNRTKKFADYVAYLW